MERNTIQELILKITHLILKENVDSTVAPIDFYNHWLQVSGTKITDLNLASSLLDFTEEALVNKQLLTHFV